MIIDVRHGDSTAIMATLDADSVDAVVTDPPYGFRLMGRHWDGGVRVAALLRPMDYMETR